MGEARRKAAARAAVTTTPIAVPAQAGRRIKPACKLSIPTRGQIGAPRDGLSTTNAPRRCRRKGRGAPRDGSLFVDRFRLALDHQLNFAVSPPDKGKLVRRQIQAGAIGEVAEQANNAIALRHNLDLEAVAVNQ
jgi:hypothetical protein